MHLVSSVPYLQRPVIERRRVLLGAAALVTTLTASACGVFGAGDPPDEPSDTPAIDPLRPIATAARTDAALAAAAAADNPTLAAPLGVAAAERSAHAVALEAEIARAAGTTPQPPATSSSPVPSSPVTSSTAPPVAVAELRAALTASAAAAGALARTAPAYRAGLLGSVAAACSAQLAVLL